MKHKLLSLFALAGAMFVSTSAMAWDEPVKPTRPAAPAYTGEFATPSDGGTYYILNVGAGQFLGAGNDWGTRAVTTTLGMVTLDGERANLSANNSHILPFTVESATPDNPLWEADFFFIRCQNTNKDETSNFLVHEDNAAWVDGWTNADNNRVEASNNGYWEIRANNGAYYLVPLDPEITPEEGETYAPLLGVHSTNMTATTSNTWCDAPANADYYVDWKFIDASEIATVKSYIENEYANYLQNQLAAYEDALEAYNAKSELLTAIQEAEEAGINVDAAGAVYNNPNASLEEVKNAIAVLRAALAGAAYDFEGASDDNPLDVTDQVLVNPTFEGNMDGWTITVGGQNLQYQGRTDGQVDPAKNWVSITGFIEAWTPSPNTLTDGTISQTVYGLPAGKYMLECDAMATKQGDADPEGAVTGAYIFIESTSNETREPIKAPDTQPKHWSVVFVSDGSPALTFGLKVENTTANWISADNFQLWYYGKTDRTREQIALDQAIAEAEAIEISEVRVAKETKTAFTDALAAAKAVQSSTDAEALTAATDALKDALSKMRTSISEYQAVGTFIEELNDMMDAADANHWDALSDDLYEWQNDINARYTEGTLESEEIAAFSDELHNKIVAFLNTPDAIQEGNDLTFLLVNPHFKTGTTGAPTGWTINNGAMTELRQSTHNIETYHAAFDLSQTLPNMPVGVYDVTLQGFARHDDGSITDKTWLYGGITKAELISLNDNEEQKRTEPIFYVDGEECPPMGDSNYDNSTATDEMGNPLYQANGMTGAYYWFQTENPNTQEPYYTNHVKVIMAQRGDLTIGIHCEATSDWVIFDNFQVKYLGVSVDIYAETIDKMLEQLNTLASAEDTYLTAEAKALVEALPAKAQTATDNADINACIAILEEIDAAMTYIREGNKKFDLLQETAQAYWDRMMITPHTDTNNYEASVTAAADCKENSESFANNDALDAALAQVKAGWAPYVLGDATDVSAENPYDATDVIFNADYLLNEENTATGWTYANAPGLVAQQNEFGEFYRNGAIEYFNTNFNISQELTGLKAGYYLVSMEGFYRAGGYEAAAKAQHDSIDARNAYMYVVNGDSLFTPFHSIFDGAQAEAINGESNEVTVTLKDAEGNDVTMYIPNMPDAANVYMSYENEEGTTNYVNKILFQAADGANVTIGARKDIQIENNWVIMGNWKLIYFGTTIPEEYVAVNSIKANTDAPTVIYGIDGRQQSQLRRGINIVRTADGTRKVMVK